MLLECENLSLTEQVNACHLEEDVLIQQLLDLNKKLSLLEAEMDRFLIERSAAINQPASQEVHLNTPYSY